MRTLAKMSSSSAYGRNMFSSRTQARCAASFFGVEYLGTTQIVTVTTAAWPLAGASCRPTSAVRVGETHRSRLQAGEAFAFRQGERTRDLDGSDGGARSWLMSVSNSVTKRFGADGRCRRPVAQDRRRRVRRAARADRRRQDDDAAPDRRPRNARSGTCCRFGGRDVTQIAAGRPRCGFRVPAILALSASCRSTTISPFRCARRRGACRRTRSSAR